jgi:lysophospholipid acyltransferase
MLLTIKDSFLVWQRLGWYGTWIIGSAFIFFYAGGQQVLKKMQVDGLKDLKVEKPLGGNGVSDA